MRKLVRDKMWSFPPRSGFHFELALSLEAYGRFLFEKLNEEIDELKMSFNGLNFSKSRKYSVRDETVDVIEVALSLATLNGWERKEVFEALERKRFERGSFDSGMILISE